MPAVDPPIRDCPDLVNEAERKPSISELFCKFELEAKERLKSSTSGSTPDFLSRRPLLPGTPIAGPYLSCSANRVFLTCHLLPLCRSADKGPGEITESISAASVRQRLLSMSSERPRQTPLPDDGH